MQDLIYEDNEERRLKFHCEMQKKNAPTSDWYYFD